MIPKNFLNNIASKFGISEKELEVLSKAIQGESMQQIADNLGVQVNSLQKRLGEVYKKLQIPGGKGPGKLIKLQQRLMEEYQNSSSLPHKNEINSTQADRKEIAESSAFSRDTFEQLSEEEVQIIYALAFADEPLTLEKLQMRISSSGELAQLLITLGEMLKHSLVEQITESGVTKFTLSSQIKKGVTYQFIQTVNQIIFFNNLDNIQILDICRIFKLVQAPHSLKPSSSLCQQLANYLTQIGSQKYLEGELVSAKYNLLLAIKLNPELAMAHYNLGATSEQLQDISSARQHYEKAASLAKKDSYPALCKLARLDILDGNFERVIEKITPLIDSVKDGEIIPELYNYLGWAYFLQNRHDEAETSLKHSLKLNQTNPVTHCLMAQVLEAKSKHKEALECWHNCLKYDVKNNKEKQQAWRLPELTLWRLQAYQRTQS